LTGALSLSSMLGGVTGHVWADAAPALALVAAALLVVFLAENGRVPVDDPVTHLELTMIHEVMVLDHGGVDLAFILYGAALKLWLLGTVLLNLVAPQTGLVIGTVVSLAGLFVLAVLVGVVESCMARLRL